MMYGAIIGDIAGSRFEFNNIKTKEFETFTDDCFFTDDTVATIAVALALKVSEGGEWEGLKEATKCTLGQLGMRHPNVGWGWKFYHEWLKSPDKKPYYSFGNGAAMRVSPVAWVARSEEEASKLAHDVTCITHNHPEGLKAAEVVTKLIWMARHGSNKDEIYMVARQYYNIDFTLDDIRPVYLHSEASQDTVPESIVAFLDSTDFEDAIHNAISIGGDSDTIAAIAGSIAEAYYGVPEWMKEVALKYLTPDLRNLVEKLDK